MKPKRDKILVVILVCATMIIVLTQAALRVRLLDTNSQTDLTMTVLYRH